MHQLRVEHCWLPQVPVMIHVHRGSPLGQNRTKRFSNRATQGLRVAENANVHEEMSLSYGC